MTAEIAILNKSAVALAADSAVTIPVAGGQKIYNTVNKLFTLSKFQPVGVMVYGSAEFMAVPWESIIKQHRRDLKETKFGTLRGYADNFVTWLSSAKLLFPEKIQQQILRGNVAGYFEQLKQEVNKRVANLIQNEGGADDARVRGIVRDIVTEQKQRWTTLPRLPTARETFEDDFLQRHAAEIDDVRKSVLQELPITREDASGLAQAVSVLLPRLFWTWCVGAGFRRFRSRRRVSVVGSHINRDAR